MDAASITALLQKPVPLWMVLATAVVIIAISCIAQSGRSKGGSRTLGHSSSASTASESNAGTRKSGEGRNGAKATAVAHKHGQETEKGNKRKNTTNIGSNAGSQRASGTIAMAADISKEKPPILAAAGETDAAGEPTGDRKDEDEEEDGEDEDEDEEDDSDDEYDPATIRNDYTPLDGLRGSKMVLCVNMGLGMGKGKMGAQCGHATLGAYLSAKEHCPTSVRLWEHFGQAKIAVKVADDAELLRVRDVARARGLVSYVVRDAGRTQIAAGSRTVLALGPAPSHMFEGVTSDLKLL